MSEIMSEIIQDYNFLKQVSTNVDDIYEAKSIIEKLEMVLKKYPNGYGLSAIQIGIPKKIAVIKNPTDFNYLINPEFVEKGEEFTFIGEGCLSFPNVYMETKRHKDFIIKNKVIENDVFREEMQFYYYPDVVNSNELESVIIEHEIEHMYGMTLLDFGKPIAIPVPIVRTNPKISRNDPCPCGSKDQSGKRIKYKKCCLGKN